MNESLSPSIDTSMTKKPRLTKKDNHTKMATPLLGDMDGSVMDKADVEILEMVTGTTAGLTQMVSSSKECLLA